MYMKSEQETVLVFEVETNEWNAYSCVPKHIRKIMDITEDYKILEEEDGRPIAIKATLSEKQVSMKKPREMSEEAREKLSERMKQMHNK